MYPRPPPDLAPRDDVDESRGCWVNVPSEPEVDDEHPPPKDGRGLGTVRSPADEGDSLSKDTLSLDATLETDCFVDFSADGTA